MDVQRKSIPFCRSRVAEGPFAESSSQSWFDIRQGVSRLEAISRGTLGSKPDSIFHVVWTLFGVDQVHDEAEFVFNAEFDRQPV